MAEPGPKKRRTKSKGPKHQPAGAPQQQPQHQLPVPPQQVPHSEAHQTQQPTISQPAQNQQQRKEKTSVKRHPQHGQTKQISHNTHSHKRPRETLQVVDIYSSALQYLESLNAPALPISLTETSSKTPDTPSKNHTPSTSALQPTPTNIHNIKALSDNSIVTSQDNESEDRALPSSDVKLSYSNGNGHTLPAPSGKKLTGWEWFRSLGSPKCVLGPMVGQSELAFRMLCRKYGVGLCYSPMFVSSKFVESKKYRDEVWSTCPEDRPLVVQFCGNDPAILLQASLLVQNQCDAIDINLGCPQEVAKRQNYGAFLMDNLALVRKLVSTLASSLSIPVVCKIRRFADPIKTLQYGKMLEEAGCSLVAIHPRTREQKEEILADWDAARALKAALNIPVILNGDIWHSEDVQACLRCSNMDGFMSAQGLLHNPALFQKVDWTIQRVEGATVPSAPFMRRRRQYGPTTSFHLAFSYSNPQGTSVGSGIADSSFFSTAEDVKRQFRLAQEYCDMVDKYPVGHPSVFRRHLFFLLFDCFQANVDLYQALFEIVSPMQARPLLERLLYRAESGKLHARAPDKKMATRRDGSLAPPPWPVGGGQLSEHDHGKPTEKHKVDANNKTSTSRRNKRVGKKV